MASKTHLIVALGNPQQGDDGFGAAVLQRLRSDPGVLAAAELLDANTDLLGNIQRFEPHERVVLLDVVLDESRAGQVVVFPEEAFADWPDRSESVHQLSVVEAVRLFRSLYPAAHVRIDLVALCVAELTRGPGLSFRSAAADGASAVCRLLASA